MIIIISLLQYHKFLHQNLQFYYKYNIAETPISKTWAWEAVLKNIKKNNIIEYNLAWINK